ncbi:Chromosome partition protein Smc [bacterium HR15]|nr:Chromosome partition protein Smc [bacterium HR15]
MPVTVDDLNDLVRLLDEHPDWREALASRLLTEQTLQRLLQANPELRASLRRMILDEEFLQLPAIVRELVEVARQGMERLGRVEERLERVEERTERMEERLERVEERTERMEERLERVEERTERMEERLERVEERTERMEERLERVEERTERMEERLERVEERTERMEERLERVEEGVDDWKQWRRGEEGRREGERYERKILRQISRLLRGGSGGSPDHERVHHRLQSWLAPLMGETIEDDADPALADIIWWKGDRVVVIEVSRKVNGRDVLRVKRRAETLRRGGVDAMPLVIGEEWAHPESQQIAQQEGVEWLVANEASDGLTKFREIPVETAE